MNKEDLEPRCLSPSAVTTEVIEDIENVLPSRVGYELRSGKTYVVRVTVDGCEASDWSLRNSKPPSIIRSLSLLSQIGNSREFQMHTRNNSAGILQLFSRSDGELEFSIEFEDGRESQRVRIPCFIRHPWQASLYLFGGAGFSIWKFSTVPGAYPWSIAVVLAVVAYYVWQMWWRPRQRANSLLLRIRQRFGHGETGLASPETA